MHKQLCLEKGSGKKLRFDKLGQARRYVEPKRFREIHADMKKAVLDLRDCESHLIRCLQEVDRSKTYRFLGCNSLFQYCLSLGLSESQSYTYISVARKAVECPELQKSIDDKEITVSKARRITAVMNERNQGQWLEMARKLPKHELEKAVAKENPKAVRPESARFVNDHMLEVQVTINEEVFKLIKRAQELACQKKQSHVDLEGILKLMAESFVEKHDPVKKAERAEKRRLKKLKLPNKQAKNLARAQLEETHGLDGQESGPLRTDRSRANGISHPNARRAIPRSIQHRVYLRDGGRCTHKDKNGVRCEQKQWLELHHIQPVSYGGADTLENLTSLCSFHHKQRHRP